MLGGVFICYRRQDSGGYAGRIYDRLAKRLGRKSVFIDVDNIPPGLDFVDVLSERVGKCDALIAVIGRNWVSISDKENRRRIDDPRDFVRIEIEAALERGVRVIPVLVEGADVPGPEDLPESLKMLSRRQGIEISMTRFDSDVRKLLRALSELEEELRQREAAEAERVAREERETREAAEAAEKSEQARRLADAEAQRAIEERRAREAAEAERAAGQERERRDAAEAVEKAERARQLAEAEAQRAIEERRAREAAEAERAARQERETREAAQNAERERLQTEVKAVEVAGEADAARRTKEEEPQIAAAKAANAGFRPGAVEEAKAPGRAAEAATAKTEGQPASALSEPSPGSAAAQAPAEPARLSGGGMKFVVIATAVGVVIGAALLLLPSRNIFAEAAFSAVVIGAALLLLRLSPVPVTKLTTPTTPQGQYEMGNNFYCGLGGFNQDHYIAMYWFRKAADQGYSDAQFMLGWLYETGLGVGWGDPRLAKAWYQKAADQGSEDAKAGLRRLEGK